MKDWSLKYRPQRLKDLRGQEVNKQILMSRIEKDNLFGVMIFYGKSGCGKTTTARILVNELNAEVIELDAASNNGVDDARNIKEIASKLALTGRKKIIIIDEAHMLSKAAWNALLKVIEEPNDKTHFIFCTTEYNAIPATIRDRSQMFKFYGFTHEELKQYAIDVLTAEGYVTAKGPTLDEACVNLIIKESNGQARDLLKRLQVAAEQGLTTAKAMRDFLGIPDTRGMGTYLTGVLSGDSRTATRALKQVAEKYDLIDWKNRLETLIYEILEDHYGLSELDYPIQQTARLRELANTYPPLLFGKILDFLLRVHRADTAYQLMYVLATLGAQEC